MKGLCEIIYMNVIKFTIAVAVLLTALVPDAGAQEAVQSVRVGVLAKRGAERCLEAWNPTAEYLSRQVPNCDFKIVPLGYGEIYPAIERKEVDFILANSSYYVAIEMQYGASRIATLKNLAGGEVNTVFGGVIKEAKALGEFMSKRK